MCLCVHVCVCVCVYQVTSRPSEGESSEYDLTDGELGGEAVGLGIGWA